MHWDKRHTRKGGGDGNGTPLQYSCLDNPMDGGAMKMEPNLFLKRDKLRRSTLCISPFYF